MSKSQNVYKAINAVQKELSKIGITKNQKNRQQGYKYRGIDDVLNALSPLLAEHGLCVLPRVLSRVVTERTTTRGGALFYVVVEMEFDFVYASDGSRHTVKIFGEAMDSADKATNKAMSAAYKYAAFQTFCIPTEGDNDADAATHEVAGAGSTNQKTIAAITAAQTMDELKRAWEAIPANQRRHYMDAKNIAKRRIAGGSGIAA